MGVTASTPFGKEIQKRLVDIEKDRNWLIEQVTVTTGLYFDRSYLHKIMTGKQNNPNMIQAICAILEIENPENIQQKERENSMFCSNCGAMVVGKFCSYCGQKVKYDVEEFQEAEQQMRRDFENSCITGGPKSQYMMELASACWIAAAMKYKKEPGKTPIIEAINSLHTVKQSARFLFNKLKDF